jgi:hypothetical protein
MPVPRRSLPIAALMLVAGAAVAAVWLYPAASPAVVLPDYPPPAHLPEWRKALASTGTVTFRLLGPPTMIYAEDHLGPDEVAYDGQRFAYRSATVALSATQINDLVQAFDQRLLAKPSVPPACIIEPGIVAVLDRRGDDGRPQRMTVAFCYACGVLVANDTQGMDLEIPMQRPFARTVLGIALAVFPGDPVLTGITWPWRRDPLPVARISLTVAIVAGAALIMWWWRRALRANRLE